MRRQTDVEGTVADDKGNSATIKGEKVETVDAPIITILAARCGPLAVSKEQGMVKENGTLPSRRVLSQDYIQRAAESELLVNHLNRTPWKHLPNPPYATATQPEVQIFQLVPVSVSVGITAYACVSPQPCQSGFSNRSFRHLMVETVQL